MPILLFLGYIALSALVGHLGRGRAIGFAGFFALSLLFTPFILALVLLVSAPLTTAGKTGKGNGKKYDSRRR